MITFREMTKDDLSFLVEVRNECREMLHDNSTFVLADAQEWFDRLRPRFYIIERNSVAVGYFRTSNWDEKNKHLYVGCDLHATSRGQGLAQIAYASFLHFLFDEIGMNKVSLEVLEHNDRARHLYQKLGFTVEGTKRQEVWRNGRYLDSQIMSMLKSEYAIVRGRLRSQ